jgi:hypothetical protein
MNTGQFARLLLVGMMTLLAVVPTVVARPEFEIIEIGQLPAGVF